MTNEVRNNKGLRVFTFFLVTGTVIGVPITLLIRTEYALLYKAWLSRTYKKLEALYEALPDEAKMEVSKQLRIAANKTSGFAFKQLTENAKVDEKTAATLINAGSKVLKVVVADTKRKIK